ncbi:MAG: hypothetical protein DI549_10795 [Ancylobacter novellus]|uniref:Uncharacterized protein n=1 Tax=Ancylobacter novellus TaxID=921 RepID=A0A2W5QV93_ANCNO|nr:MAG: hypothetical protein DI549_10795 [Ancylobacter novellus]
MQKLTFERAVYWLDLGPGVRVEVLPFGTEVELRALDIPPQMRADLGSEDRAVRSLALIKAFGRGAIIGWEGVEVEGRADDAPWPEGTDALLSTSPHGRAFEAKYVIPALLAVQEKNASAPSPNGTSAAAATTVPPATTDATAASTAPKPH